MLLTNNNPIFFNTTQEFHEKSLYSLCSEKTINNNFIFPRQLITSLEISGTVFNIKIENDFRVIILKRLLALEMTKIDISKKKRIYSKKSKSALIFFKLSTLSKSFIINDQILHILISLFFPIYLKNARPKIDFKSSSSGNSFIITIRNLNRIFGPNQKNLSAATYSSYKHGGFTSKFKNKDFLEIKLNFNYTLNSLYCAYLKNELITTLKKLKF